MNRAPGTSGDDLQAADGELLDLLQGSDISALSLDTELTLRRFTPAAAAAMNLRADDIGRPIDDVSPVLAGEALVNNARAVLAHHAVIQDEIQEQDGRWFVRRILPRWTTGNQVDGVIVTLTDITGTKRSAEATLAQMRALAATLEARVNERTLELGALAGALSLAEDRERQTVAADLHDDLAQLLSIIKLKLVGLGRQSDAAGMHSAVEEIAGLIDTADARVRNLATQLSNPVLHQLGLVAALSALSDEMRRDYHLHVALHDDGVDKELESPVGMIVFRAVRELLVNVAKHAGTLRSEVRCEVDCHRSGQTLVVVVSDDGRGFDPGDLDLRGKGHDGLGLPLIRERLRFIGGRFDIVSKPGSGVEATIMVPLGEAAPARERGEPS